MQNLKQMGHIPLDEIGDLAQERQPNDLTVYEDVRVKTRAIGFIWPERNLIVKL